ncbi:hypothetical protein B7494_g547 [Chlorociboria aeruginascens]|nr:hypothetical protein B7494_g547 [Chlorociboria aeruginascens]
MAPHADLTISYGDGNATPRTVGSHVPWSEETFRALDDFEEEGSSTVFGYEQKFNPITTALLNGTFIQSVELDDYHSSAPLHSNSIVLPALFSAVEAKKKGSTPPVVDGATFLLSSIVGFEVGPRAGLALYGGHMLTMGWHSGAIFGPPAAAAAVSKLFGLSPLQTEDAIGTACTQACGLMAAQYGGMVKRMHHGFAARSGLLSALLARSGYTGIRKVFERPYGGYLAMFSSGSGKTPPYKEEEIIKGLGSMWHTEEIRLKAYASCAGCHGLIDAISKLQKQYPERMADLESIRHIQIDLSDPVFHHNGWKAEERPVTSTGGQMNAGYVAATMLVDGQVLLEQFAASHLDRDAVWDLVWKTDCVHNPEFDYPDCGCGAIVKIEFEDGTILIDRVEKPKGIDPVLSNEDVVDKWRKLTHPVMDVARANAIEKLVLDMENVKDVREILSLLGGEVKDSLSLE